MARTRVRLSGLALLLGSLTAIPTQVSAEAFLDLYGGIANTASGEVTVEVNTSCITIIVPLCSSQTATRNVEFGSSVTVGGRLGYWSESRPWLGGALDVSSFQADGENVEISLTPISFLLMLRWPLLVSDDFPKGRLQPYGAVGPGIFLADMEADFRPTVPFKVDEFGVGIGLDTRAGLAWQFHPRVALFGEYRFTLVNVKKEKESGFGQQVGDGGVETTLKTNHFLAGVSFRFQ